MEIENALQLNLRAQGVLWESLNVVEHARLLLDSGGELVAISGRYLRKVLAVYVELINGGKEDLDDEVDIDDGDDEVE